MSSLKVLGPYKLFIHHHYHTLAHVRYDISGEWKGYVYQDSDTKIWSIYVSGVKTGYLSEQEAKKELDDYFRYRKYIIINDQDRFDSIKDSV